MLVHTYENIKVEMKNNVCVVTLNRPELRNALGQEMREELRSFFTSIKDNDEVKVIILTGEGKAFSAGGDLSALKTVDTESGRKRLQAGHEMIHSILELEKPVIAAVNGIAAGAGSSLALACDLIVATHSTIFIQNFIKVGLILAGGKISADQAEKMGVIYRIVPDDLLLEEALSLAATLAEGSAIAMGITKKLTNRSVMQKLVKNLS